MVRDALNIVPISAEAFEQSAQLCRTARISLRTGDALHLAVAQLSQATIHTFDKRLVRAAASLGIAAALVH